MSSRVSLNRDIPIFNECDGLYEQYVDRFIIPLGGESDSDDDDLVDSDDSESATETASSEEDADCVSDSSECSCDEP